MMNLSEKNAIRRQINRLYSEMYRALSGAAGKGALNEQRARNRAASIKTEISYLSNKIA